MEANLIIIGVVLICSVVLIMIGRNFRDKDDLLKSMNAEADGPHKHSERENITE